MSQNQSRSNAPEVVCIGESMALVTPSTPARLRVAPSFDIQIGGAESTVALYLADYGHHSSWISQVGNDPLGERMLDELRGHGVDVAGVRVVDDAPTGVYFKDPDDESTSVYYYRAGSAASQMTPGIVDSIDWAATRVVHISGITAGLSASCRSLLDAVIERAHATATMVSFDVNYRPKVWDIATAAPVLAGLAARSDIVFVGRDEAELLWGASSAAELFQRLEMTGTLIVKDGDIGATAVSVDDEVFVPALTVDVVETVGAGDAFTAGYLSALIRDMNTRDRLSKGHATAARALSSTRDFVSQREGDACPRAFNEPQKSLN
ncbi:2-dehydro-3-deoxygluconokinase [Leucobacter exalbidus]|uniref:2-dehydro-3-deoxygluconokinase n=1 Tax=Leucobacter exalbidus TaxID=662960 RepID=A0A940PVX7_9MICO|nr:sugar kinase [Leucobacter exalbidus]MBP1326274.1 2-dehydro-3-deoxygluconokinase [Leucobacter exalbidus]